jgi:hypothetical protein
MTSRAIHLQFDIANSAAYAKCMRDGAALFASPVQVKVRCVKGARAKKCGNAGKIAK